MRQRAVISLPFSVIAHGGGAVQRAVINAPVPAFTVTFGQPDGAVAGETLTVPYVASAPVVTSWLVLADGRELVVTVTPSTLTVDLPQDTPEAQATLYVANAAGDEASTTLVISGVLAPPVTVIPRVGGLPLAPEIRRSRSHGRARTRYGVTVATTSRGRARAGAAYGVRSIHASLSKLRVGSNTSVLVRPQTMRTTAVLSVTAAVVRRQPEGPRMEEELLLLL